jgi:pimeloyl-ACP methyl ester carboxylesterase
LLLAHGIGMSHRAFAAVVDPLAEEFDVVAVDLPGFGASPPLAGPPTLRALTEACAEHMAALGHDRFHVAGNSLGGGIALHLGLDGRALSACALSPVGFVEGWERAYLQVSLANARALAPVAPALLRTAGRAGPGRRALVRQYAEHGERLQVDYLIAAFRDVAGASGFAATQRHAVQWRCPSGAAPHCPVTVAWGEHDRLLLARPQAARARARLPSARHVALPDCGHLPAWDDPALVARVVREAATGP